MHLNQITSPQPQQHRLEFRWNCDRQLAGCHSVCFSTFQRQLTADN